MHICSFQLNGIVQELETVLFIEVSLAFKSDAHLADLFIEFLPEKLSFGKLVPHDILVEVDEKTGKTCWSGFITYEFDRAWSQYINFAMQDNIKGISSISVIEESGTCLSLLQLHATIEVVLGFNCVFLSHLLEEFVTEQV